MRINDDVTNVLRIIGMDRLVKLSVYLTNASIPAIRNMYVSFIIKTHAVIKSTSIHSYFWIT